MWRVEGGGVWEGGVVEGVNVSEKITSSSVLFPREREKNIY